MATQFEKPGNLMLDRGRLGAAEPERSKTNGDLGLCLALIVLVVLALLVSFH